MFEKEIELFMSFRKIATPEQMYKAKIIANTYGYYQVQEYIKECVEKRNP
jgi:hypothetical protein